MNYAAVTPGQVVMYNFHRSNHPRYNFKDSKPARVLEVGVRHDYDTTESGWGGRKMRRTTDKGILIEVLPYKHRGLMQGSPPLVTSRPRQQTTLAAYLHPMTPEAMEAFEHAQAELVAAVEAEAVEAEENRRVIQRMAELGFTEVAIHGDGHLLIRKPQVERLLYVLSQV